MPPASILGYFDSPPSSAHQESHPLLCLLLSQVRPLPPFRGTIVPPRCTLLRDKFTRMSHTHKTESYSGRKPIPTIPGHEAEKSRQKDELEKTREEGEKLLRQVPEKLTGKGENEGEGLIGKVENAVGSREEKERIRAQFKAGISPIERAKAARRGERTVDDPVTGLPVTLKDATFETDEGMWLFCELQMVMHLVASTDQLRNWDVNPREKEQILVGFATRSPRRRRGAISTACPT